MKILTWYGTIVRVDRGNGMRIHAPLWPLRDIAEDLDWDLPRERSERPRILPGDPPIAVQSVPKGRGLQLMRGDRFLSAQPGMGEVEFRSEIFRPSEMFMPFSATEIDRLRDILGHSWDIVETGEPVQGGDAWLVDGFVLRFGRHHILLEHEMPVIDMTRQTITFTDDQGNILNARRRTAIAARDELLLTRAGMPPPEVADEIAFAQAGEATLRLRGGTEYGFLPLVANISHQAWMHARASRGIGPTLGPYETGTRVVRQRDKYVLLTAGQEGVVFDEDGVYNEAGYLYNHFVHERGVLMREGNHVFIDRSCLDSASRLPGTYAVFFNGNLSNYYHWIIDSLLPLFIMKPYLPSGAKLLIPPRIESLRQKPGIVDHMAAIAAWGFDDMPTLEVPGPVCRLEEVVWVDQVLTVNIMAETLRAARAHVLSRVAPAGPARQIYVRRPGSRGVLNDAQVEAALAPLGFVAVEMEGLSPLQQIELFRDADQVVAAHGAAMSNILYCAPGTRVLELSPDTEYRSIFAELSDKLGLVHAVLPCQTDSDDYHGGMRMEVDIVALGRLLTQLRNWHVS